MSTWTQYTVVNSIDEALQALSTAELPVSLVAGGTDLLLELQQGHHAPVKTLVDIASIPELKSLQIRGQDLFIGAAVPVSQIAESELVSCHARAVVEACQLIGGPQVRNSATLGGNVAHALPAADGMIALVAQGAQAEITRQDGSRRVPLLTLFLGPGKSGLESGKEILTGFYLPVKDTGEGSAFARVMRPQGVALPILNMAVWLRRKGEQIAAARIAVGPAGPTPQRAWKVEELLSGKEFSSQTLQEAIVMIRSTMTFRSSPQRASAEYRNHLVGILLEDVMKTAWKRAGEVA